MVALNSPLSEPFPRSPLAVAQDVRNNLRNRFPALFGRMELRVANGAVAVTGSVPDWNSKTMALGAVRQAFQQLAIIDALEVANQRTLRIAARPEAAA